MPKTIYKYPLEVTDLQELELPEGAEILTVQMQTGVPCLWALVDPTADKKCRLIRIAGTGHFLNDEIEHRYIGTFQMAGGQLVFHAFEVLA